jgi:hypothetical protein
MFFFKKKVKRYTFTPDELQRMQAELVEQNTRKEIIELLDSNSGNFAEWSVIINQTIQPTSDKERAMLENLSALFNKLAAHGDLLALWHKQLTVRKGSIERMIKEGHP